MKVDVQLELLETAAEQLGVRVSYETLQIVAGAGLRGGLCKVKGANGMEWRVIVDRRATSEERIATLATALGRFDTSELELPAPIRDTLRLHSSSASPVAKQPKRPAAA